MPVSLLLAASLPAVLAYATSQTQPVLDAMSVSEHWANPKAVLDWTGKGGQDFHDTTGNECQYKQQTVSTTIDDNLETSWNAHPCRPSTPWFIVYDLGNTERLAVFRGQRSKRHPRRRRTRLGKKVKVEEDAGVS